MGVAQSLDKRINSYLSHLNIKQKEAVLTVVKTFAEEETDTWKDKNFIAELDRRALEYESGKAKIYTLEQMETNARHYHKTQSRKKRWASVLNFTTQLPKITMRLMIGMNNRNPDLVKDFYQL